MFPSESGGGPLKVDLRSSPAVGRERKRLVLVSAPARSRYRHTGCMMAEGGGPESGSAADSDSEPVAAQMPTPSTENQKQTIGSLLKTSLKKGDEW